MLDARYRVEERMTLDVHGARAAARWSAEGWALNDVAVEKTARARMLELVVEVDGRPLSRWGGDGVVFATPTGSTAYAFSAGGPVVWPEVEALLLVPISAHALFSRPLVTAPGLGARRRGAGGRRTPAASPATAAAPSSCRRGPGSRSAAGSRPVRLARLAPRPFTDRLVAKFALPVEGWRGAGHRVRGLCVAAGGRPARP